MRHFYQNEILISFQFLRSLSCSEHCELGDWVVLLVVVVVDDFSVTPPA